MDTLEEHLTRDLAAATSAADLRVPSRADIVAAVRERRRLRRLRAGVAVAAVALVSAGVASVYVADRHDRTTIGDDRTTPTPTTTSTPATPSTSRTTPATTAAPPPPVVDETAEGLVLRGDGLGRARIGMPAPDAIAAVGQRLGAPTSDSGVTPLTEPGLRGPGCEGVAVERVVTWHGVTFGFVGATADALVLNWIVAGNGLADVPPVVTGEGVALTAPVAEWEAAYGDRFTIVSTGPSVPPGTGPEFDTVRVVLPGGEVSGYANVLSDREGVATLVVEGPCSPAGDV